MQPEPDISKATELRPSVTAIITNGDGHVLLQLRSDNSLWGLPGGSVEIGESVTAALMREVWEETGLTVEIGRLVGVYSDPASQVVRYPDGAVVHYINTLCTCRVVRGTLQTCDESLDLRYFDPTRLPENMVGSHRIRVADAVAGRPEGFIR